MQTIAPEEHLCGLGKKVHFSGIHDPPVSQMRRHARLNFVMGEVGYVINNKFVKVRRRCKLVYWQDSNVIELGVKKIEPFFLSKTRTIIAFSSEVFS